MNNAIHDHRQIAGYLFLNSDTIVSPFYDAIYQCMGNVDQFHIFFDPGLDQRSISIINEFTGALSQFFEIKSHPLQMDLGKTGSFQNANESCLKYLESIGFEYALMIGPCEFFPTSLKPFLLECISNGQKPVFEKILIGKNEQAIKACGSLRFFKCSDISYREDSSLESFRSEGFRICPEAIHGFDRLFAGDDPAGTGGSDADIFKARNFRIREREYMTVKYSKKYPDYPHKIALGNILENCRRDQSNAEGLEVCFSFTQGYKKSLAVSLDWTDAYGVTESLVNKYNIKNMAEVGVARGHHSLHLLEAVPDLHLYSIDPWGYYLDEHENMVHQSLDEIDKLYETIVSFLKPFGGRSTILRHTSMRAAPLVKEQLDMVFIDADHSYKSVKEDLGIWWEKVRAGGIVSGHDYNHSAHPGVTKAVNEYFAHKGIHVKQEIGHVWWVQKPAELLSYIIPSYNAEKFLEATIESIFKQDLNIPFEVVISDDNSTDNTRSLLDKMAQKHPEIRLLLNDKNLGAPANRNSAISQSKGNFILMLDHDNILEPDSVQKLIDAMNRRGCGAASFGELFFFKNDISNHKGSWIYRYPEDLFTLKEYITYANSPAASNNYMFTRTAFERTGGYPERGARENIGFGLRLLATGTPIAIVSGTKYFHRILSSGMWQEENTKKPEQAHISMVGIFREYLNLFDADTQKLLQSDKSLSEADTYIARKKLKLSDEGWILSGGRDKYKPKIFKKIEIYKLALIKTKYAKSSVHLIYASLKKIIGENASTRLKDLLVNKNK